MAKRTISVGGREFEDNRSFLERLRQEGLPALLGGVGYGTKSMLAKTDKSLDQLEKFVESYGSEMETNDKLSKFVSMAREGIMNGNFKSLDDAVKFQNDINSLIKTTDQEQEAITGGKKTVIEEAIKAGFPVSEIQGTISTDNGYDILQKKISEYSATKESQKKTGEVESGINALVNDYSVLLSTSREIRNELENIYPQINEPGFEGAITRNYVGVVNQIAQKYPKLQAFIEQNDAAALQLAVAIQGSRPTDADRQVIANILPNPLRGASMKDIESAKLLYRRMEKKSSGEQSKEALNQFAKIIQDAEFPERANVDEIITFFNPEDNSTYEIPSGLADSFLKKFPKARRA